MRELRQNVFLQQNYVGAGQSYRKNWD